MPSTLQPKSRDGGSLRPVQGLNLNTDIIVIIAGILTDIIISSIISITISDRLYVTVRQSVSMVFPLSMDRERNFEIRLEVHQLLLDLPDLLPTDR